MFLSGARLAANILDQIPGRGAHWMEVDTTDAPDDVT
jgi:hypothetical protein